MEDKKITKEEYKKQRDKAIKQIVDLLNKYNLTIKTNDLILGTNILTLLSQSTKFESQTIQFFIEVGERAPDAGIFRDSSSSHSSDAFWFLSTITSPPRSIVNSWFPIEVTL